MGAIRNVDPVVEAAYEFLEQRAFRDQEDDSPHGSPWFTSFHASSFPGNDPRACGRQEIYSMMDIPANAPFNRRGRTIMDAGKDIEYQLVKRLHDAGYLLSAAPWAEIQTGFVDKETWLTGNCDAIILHRGSLKPFVVEVKTKSEEHVKEMQGLTRDADPKHVNQAKTYVGEAHDKLPEMMPTVMRCPNTQAVAIMNPKPNPFKKGKDKFICPIHRHPDCLQEVELEPCTEGAIYYLSRDNPWNTFEFFIEYDPEFMKVGKERLKAWREAYLSGTLPPHPFGGKEWSKSPCQYCKFKKHACKPDDKAGITRLEDSHAIPYAKKIRPDYDFNTKREQVIERWKETDAE